MSVFANLGRGFCAVVIFLPPASQILPPAPPPPPVKEGPKAPTPARIVVGKNHQFYYGGPASYWVNEQPLSDAELERAILANADDLCARGRLIAFYPYDRPETQRIAGLTHFEHLLWMVRNHPEWDGFSVEPFYNAANRPRWKQESYELLKEAWSQQVSHGSPKALVLHNAAMFFAFKEPSTAADLLRRAIQLEPAERFYLERLGLVYGYAQVGPEGLKRFGVIATPERDAFAQRAWFELLHASDWVLVRGAVDALNYYTCPACRLDPAFESRLEELRKRADLLSATNQEAPSELRRTLGRACAAQAAGRR
jgi:hypothetical protein